MLHLRRALPRRAAEASGAAIRALWDRMVAADPGLLRLVLAARGTTSVLMMTIVAVVAGRLLHIAPVEFAPGITFSLMAPFLMREPTRRQRERTLWLLALPALCASVATTLLHGRGQLGDGFFLVLVFVCFLLQSRTPRAIGQGLVAMVTSYIGLYLELPPNTLPAQILAVGVALPVTWFACFVVLPLQPAVTLRRTMQAVQGRAAMVLRDAGALVATEPATAKRLRRSLARLNEAALAADDQLALLDPDGSLPTRLRLIDLELAAARLAAAPAEAASTRQTARFVVHQRRLRRSRWSARDQAGMPASPARSPVAAALAEITRIASALEQAGAELPNVAPRPSVAAPPGPFAWRVALRVTLASALAMAGGMALSPQRWFWAVITTYLVFLNARSRGDAIFRGIQRVGGTLLGLVAGLSLAAVLQGDGLVQAVVLLGSVFGMYYFFFVSYTIGIFFVTILLSMLYSMLGASMEPLLVLRLEETAIGAVAGMVVAAFVFPSRTREQVARSGIGVLNALAAVVGMCQRSLAGHPTAPAVAAMRAVDRQVADLRLALVPFNASGILLRRSVMERPVPALLECVHWARMLAVAATTPDAAAAARAAVIERRLAALAAGDRSVVKPQPSLGLPSRAALALDRLDQATAVLAERLAIGELQGFHLEG